MLVAASASTDINVHAPGPPKRLVFCFDGTWNRLDAQTPTNVVLTAESVLPMARDGKAQVIFYDEGVGTGKFDRLSGGVFGAGIVDKLGDAYRFLTFNYTPGDELFIFGFSRGAFTARSFVGLLRHCGVVSRSQAGRIKEAIDWYRNRDPKTCPDTSDSRRLRAELSPAVLVEDGEEAWRTGNVPNYAAGSAVPLAIRYLGVWDTVGALGVPTRYRALAFFNRKYQFHDARLSALVRSGRHAVAIDERRADFTPTLWENIDPLNQAAGAQSLVADALYQERWFPGVHCGVGGGGDFRGLSDQALVWVWDGAQRAGLSLDAAPGSRTFELAPDPASPISPFNLAKLGMWDRLKAGAMDRLWQRADRKGPALLDSVARSARLRWKMAASALPEAAPYRPMALKDVATAMDAWPAPVLPPAGSYREVRVQFGDTLGTIAARELGDAKRWQEVFTMNPDRLDDADHIFCGMQLRLPLA